MVGSRQLGAAGAAVWLVSWCVAACGGATGIEVDGDGTGSGGGSATTGGATGTGARAGSGGAVTPGTGGKVAAGGASVGGRPVGNGGVVGGFTSGTGGVGGASGSGGKAAYFLYAIEFDRSCKYDTDCVTVTEGNQCTPQECPNAGISVSASTAWYDRLKNIPCSGGTRAPAPDCAPVMPACNAGTCTLRGFYTPEPSSYDQTCSADSDCFTVQAAEVCDACQCTWGTVSSLAVREYQNDSASQATCTPPPSPCDCGEPPRAFCLRAPGPGKGRCGLR